MNRRSVTCAALAGLALWACAVDCRAQAMVPVPSYPSAPCTCGGQVPHYYHTVPDRTGSLFGNSNGSGPGAGRSNGNEGLTSENSGPITGLPRGRRYYGGRFFGSFNNRYYGPQYGNF